MEVVHQEKPDLIHGEPVVPGELVPLLGGGHRDCCCLEYLEVGCHFSCEESNASHVLELAGQCFEVELLQRRVRANVENLSRGLLLQLS